ncbi:MAG: hypothetical protein U1E45_04930 [Geminicoccaceae bacterium]
MSAANALNAARALGMDVCVDGDDLHLHANAEPPGSVLELLSRHKAEIIHLLRGSVGGWAAEDWHDFFEERAAIAEFDGGLPRDQAKARAYLCCVAEWLDQDQVNSSPDRCLACGGGDQSTNPLLPHGVETASLAWLHDRCWSGWEQGRWAQAAAALAQMGITTEEFSNDFGKIDSTLSRKNHDG